MIEPHLPYPLDLGDGREPIMCRDAHQASLLLGLWRAWKRSTVDEGCFSGHGGEVPENAARYTAGTETAGVESCTEPAT